jgi:hypothetical protein
MSYLRILTIIAAVLLVAQMVFAYEAPLSNFGFTEVSLSGQPAEKCQDILVSLPKLSQPEVGSSIGAGILSINASFDNPKIDNTFVSVAVNDSEPKMLWTENFTCKGECFGRIFLPELSLGETKLTICVALGGETKSIKVWADSTIGLYDTPMLSIKNTAPNLIHLGERAKLSTVLSNTGTSDANIYIQFIHPDTRARVSITSFDIVDGESSARTFLKAGETKQFDYYIKPSIVSTFNLPSAAMFFTNIFGESQVILSNHPFMRVIIQEPIEVSLVSIIDTQPFALKALIKNNTSSEFSGKVILSPQTALEEPVIDFIVPAGGEREVPFKAKILNAGTYTFSATIVDSNNIYTSNSITLEAKQAGISFEILIAIIGVLAGLAIFIWIYFIKSN